MTEREKLILHLQNLHKSNIKNATLGVAYLLEILNALPAVVEPKKPKFQDTQIDVDGGTFTTE